MKVHLIKIQSLLQYSQNNNQSKTPINKWINVLKYVNWEKPSDIINTYNTADILGKNTNRVVFNIGGNKYRLICKYSFGNKRVHLFVKWIGTHPEYTKLCNKNEQYSINQF
jgi:mRNA interferase HigB